jgi:hypothetical protein
MRQRGIDLCERGPADPSALAILRPHMNSRLTTSGLPMIHPEPDAISIEGPNFHEPDFGSCPRVSLQPRKPARNEPGKGLAL